MVRKISGAFSGGVVGALVDSINIWLLSHAGVTAMLGIRLKPQFTGPWLYPRLVWGGIWALLLLLPILKAKTGLRGIVMSLFPSAMMLFVVFPETGNGMLGLTAGTLTPVLVIGLNCIYGMIASFWHKGCGS